MAEPFEISLPAVSRHLKVLERAQLIAREKDAQWRRCQLRAQVLQGVSDWVSAYERFWERQFDSLEGYLDRIQKREDDDEHGTGNKRDGG